jgi:hypothetical protein
MPAKLQLGFDCGIVVERDKLRVLYEVRNQSGSDVGLFNRLTPLEANKPPAPGPDNVYIDFDSGLLELMKQVLPVPRGMQVSAQYVPLVSKLPHGERFREEFAVPLPAKVNNPMRQMVLTAANRGSIIVPENPTEAHQVRVCIGAFAVEPGARFIEDSGALRVWPPGPAVDGQIVLSKTIDLPHRVPVLSFAARKMESR